MGFSRDESAIYLAAKMAREFTMALQKRAAALGFSPGQFPILIELWHEEGLTQRQLLDRIDVEQATLANTLSRMERDGLIVRKTHPGDRRAQIIELTQRGRDLEANAIAASEATEEMLLAVSGVLNASFCWNICAAPSRAQKKQNSASNSKPLRSFPELLYRSRGRAFADSRHAGPCFPRCAMPGCFVLSPGHDRHDRISDDRRFPHSFHCR